MNLPSKENLPYSTKEQVILIDSQKIEEFHRAFRDQLTYTPPTLMAVSMKGIFDLLNEFQIDWKKLLHATQSFTYHENFQVPTKVAALTQLMDIRSRASMYWFQFETVVRDETTKKPLITCKSLLMTSESI